MPKNPAAMAQAAPAPPAAPVDPNKVVLTIGTTSITAGQYDQIVEALPQQYQAFARGAGKRQFAENYVQLQLLSDEAEKLKLDQTPLVKEQLVVNRKDILARAMIDELQKQVKLDDSLVQLYFDAHKGEYESVKAKHILIRIKGAPMPGKDGQPELTEEQALAKATEIRKKLLAGADFSTVAKAESDDTVSAAQGGDLGEFRHGMMVPPFEKAAFAQKVGEVGEPVLSPFGYHIILVEEHKTKTLAEVKPDIEKVVRPEMARKQLEAMRSKSSVKIDDGFFGPPEPPAGAPGAPGAMPAGHP